MFLKWLNGIFSKFSAIIIYIYISVNIMIATKQNKNFMNEKLLWRWGDRIFKTD